jgi:hypothetical protein
MATIIHPDGREQEAKPANGSFFAYDEIRHIIGGGIDTLPTTDQQILFFCGTNQSSRNMKAMELAGITIDPDAMKEADYIHGTVLLCVIGELRMGQK